MLGFKKDVPSHVRLLVPLLGAARQPGPHLKAHRAGVDRVLAEVMRIERTADSAANRLLASQLAEATVATLSELTGEDLTPLREKLASHAIPSPAKLRAAGNTAATRAAKIADITVAPSRPCV